MQVLFADDGSPAPDNIVRLSSADATPFLSGTNKSIAWHRPIGEIAFRFTQSSQQHNNRAFVICAWPLDQPRTHLCAAYSRAIFVWPQMLHPVNDLPTEFHKDQGGRDKCMTLHLEHRGEKMLQQATPLTVQLVYDIKGFPPVADQSILRLMRDTKLVLHPVHGATIHFRIDGFQSYRSSKRFRLRVSTNDPSIAPALSSAVRIIRHPSGTHEMHRRAQDIKTIRDNKVKKAHSLCILRPVQHTFPPSFARV